MSVLSLFTVRVGNLHFSSKSLILKRDCEQSAHVAHYKRATVNNLLMLLFTKEQREQINLVALLKRAIWVIRSWFQQIVCKNERIAQNISFFVCYWQFPPVYRVGNLLTGFKSKSLVFWEKMSKWAIHSKKMSDSLIFGERPERFLHSCSFLVSDLSDLLTVAHFWWATWVNHSHRSFLVSDLSDSLKSLFKKEGMSKSLIF